MRPSSSYRNKSSAREQRESRESKPSKSKFQCSGSTFIVDSNYEFIKQIGQGAYGVVVSALDKSTNKKIAIKKVGNAFDDLVDAKRILREIKLLRFLKHDNIISLYDLPIPESKVGYKDIYIITELMETDLHRVIYSRQELSEEHIQYFLYQILLGVNFMHSANVMHRDLKPSNLLLNKNCDLKICDLGLSRGFEQEDEFKTEYVVTRWYRAPEVILKASEYTKAIDIWSVGCIFAELLGRTPIFPGKDYLEQIQRIISILGTPSIYELSYVTNEGALKYLKGLPKRTRQDWSNLFTNASKLGQDLLTHMLTFNPNNRFTAEQCLNHPYFDDLRSEEDIQISSKVFDWAWDNFELKESVIQTKVYEESVSFRRNK